MGTHTIAGNLSRGAVRVVNAHDAAQTLQRCARGMLGRRVASARQDEVLSSLVRAYLLACAHEGARPFKW